MATERSTARTTEPLVATVTETSALLRVSRRTVWRLVSLGLLDRVKIGRAVRVTRASIDKFVLEGGAK